MKILETLLEGSDMNRYIVEVEVCYSGREKHKVEVEAENEMEAEEKAAEMVDENYLDMHHPEIDDYYTKVISETEIPEDTRCKLTPDMFASAK